MSSKLGDMHSCRSHQKATRLKPRLTKRHGHKPIRKWLRWNVSGWRRRVQLVDVAGECCVWYRRRSSGRALCQDHGRGLSNIKLAILKVAIIAKRTCWFKGRNLDEEHESTSRSRGRSRRGIKRGSNSIKTAEKHLQHSDRENQKQPKNQKPKTVKKKNKQKNMGP